MKKLTNTTRIFNEVDLSFGVKELPTVNQVAAKLDRKFERYTIGDSWYANEFRILNSKYGFHHSGAGLRLCEYEFYEHVIEEGSFYLSREVEERVKTITNNELKYDDFIEMVLESKIATQEELDKIIEEINKDINESYVEITIKGDKVHFYIDNHYGECYDIKLNDRWHDNKYNELYINGYTLEGKESLYDQIKERTHQDIAKLIDAGVAKIENGYIYDNKYYENIGEIIEEVEALGK